VRAAHPCKSCVGSNIRDGAALVRGGKCAGGVDNGAQERPRSGEVPSVGGRTGRMISPINKIWALLFVAALAAACSDDNTSGGAFECQGKECVCPASGDCWVLCAGSCDLQC